MISLRIYRRVNSEENVRRWNDDDYDCTYARGLTMIALVVKQKYKRYLLSMIEKNSWFLDDLSEEYHG